MLWEVLVMQFAAFLDRLTIRKVVEFVAIALLVMAFAQTLPLDLAILFAGDILTYLEFVIAIRLAAGVMHVRATWNQVTRFTRLLLCALTAAARLPALTFTRLRERRTAAVSKPRRSYDSSDDDRGLEAWAAFAPA
jgi:hypothetical protein